MLLVPPCDGDCEVGAPPPGVPPPPVGCVLFPPVVLAVPPPVIFLSDNEEPDRLPSLSTCEKKNQKFYILINIHYRVVSHNASSIISII